MKNEVKEKLAGSLTANDVGIIDFLPYLLQDFYDIGAVPEDVAEVFKEYIYDKNKDFKVLDLGCGKGAVSIRLAKEFGVKTKGIDIMKAFINEAENKAREYSVEDLCDFQVGDINEAVRREKGYDVVILGAVGDVLGSPEETLELLKDTIKPSGYIIIDDAYYREGKSKEDLHHKYDYLTRKEWIHIFDRNNLEYIAEIKNDETIDGINDDTDDIAKRAEELIEKYPEKEEMFRDYIKSQAAECYDLENNIYGAMWVLKSE